MDRPEREHCLEWCLSVVQCGPVSVFCPGSTHLLMSRAHLTLSHTCFCRGPCPSLPPFMSQAYLHLPRCGTFLWFPCLFLSHLLPFLSSPLPSSIFSLFSAPNFLWWVLALQTFIRLSHFLEELQPDGEDRAMTHDHGTLWALELHSCNLLYVGSKNGSTRKVRIG